MGSDEEMPMLNEEELRMARLVLRSEDFLVSWLNKELEADCRFMEGFSTGAVFCQILDKIKPGLIDLRNVDFVCNRMSSFEGNFRILKQGLLELGIRKKTVEKVMPMEKLLHGHHYTLGILAKWMRRLFRLHAEDYLESKVDYNPRKRRGFQAIRIAAPLMCDAACQAELGPDMVRIRLVRWDLNLIDEDQTLVSDGGDGDVIDRRPRPDHFLQLSNASYDAFNKAVRAYVLENLGIGQPKVDKVNASTNTDS
ncbi:microtubule-associated protein RP/EB family member 1-like [Drosophila bipectinata]|uniref:microtubule-associated protein RP/EB family member 1-like n=1 Tax=Drosophila bipectinata TaxID=42026 RepID=UPI0038B2EF43